MLPLESWACDGGGDRRVAVAQQGRTGAQVVVDVLPPGHVDHVAALALGDDQVDLGGQGEEAQAPAGQVAIGLRQQLLLPSAGAR